MFFAVTHKNIMLAMVSTSSLLATTIGQPAHRKRVRNVYAPPIAGSEPHAGTSQRTHLLVQQWKDFNVRISTVEFQDFTREGHEHAKDEHQQEQASSALAAQRDLAVLRIARKKMIRTCR
jgi:hypothetical protein